MSELAFSNTDFNIDKRVDDLRDNIVSILQSLPQKGRPFRSPVELLTVAADALTRLKEAMEELRTLAYIVRVENAGLGNLIESASQMSESELELMDKDTVIEMLKAVS